MGIRQLPDGTYVDDATGASLNDFPTMGAAYPPAPTVAAPSGEATTQTAGDGVAGPAPGNEANAIQGMYTKYLGRQATDAEIQSHLGNPGGISAVENLIANSPEAQTYASKQQAPPAAGAAGGATTTQGGGGLFDSLSSPLLQPWTVPFNYQPYSSTATYKPPTIDDLYNSPGYQARLEAGRQSMERGAAAKGTLLTGGTVRDEDEAAQTFASNEFGNLFNQNLTNFGTAYNRDLTDWTTNYNKALQGYQQAYNIFSNNQANQFNRLAAVSGIGQTAAGQLGSSGLGYANAFTNTTQGNATNLGDLYGQQANAQAAGNVGSTNAWNNAVGNAANLGSLYASSYGQKQQQ